MGGNGLVSRVRIVAVAAMLLFIFATAAHAATFNLLYSFAGGSDGAMPFNGNSLVSVGSILYGVTIGGGGGGSNAGYGTIFTFDPATDAETVVHAFQGPDGAGPWGGLVQSATSPDTLYGATTGGGANPHYGTVFSFNTATNAVNTVWSFGPGASGGGMSPTGVTQCGGVLYGTTLPDLYALNTNTNALTVLPNFTYSQESDAAPVLVGNTLYGTGQVGLWSYNLSTNTEAVIQTGAGNFPLTASDGILYGTTGSSIFSYNTTSGAFTTLISGVSSDGGPLLLDGSILYGESQKKQDVFAYDIDTDQYSVLYSFPTNGTDPDGLGPTGGLTMMGSTLYGMTHQGGANGDGVIFSITVPEPGTLGIIAVAGGYLLSRRRR